MEKKNYAKYAKSGGAILIITLICVNILNFIFNAFLGRFLSFDDYALVTLINTFNYLLLIVISALSSTVNHRVAYLTAQNNNSGALHFFLQTRLRAVLIAIGFSLLFLILSPFISNFFQESSIIPVVLFAPTIFLGVFVALSRGYLTGSMYFKYVALILFIEALGKLLLGILMTLSGFPSLAYLSIPLSTLIASVASFVIVKQTLPKEEKKDLAIKYKFPRKFFSGTVLTGLSSTAFLSFDVLLAKHFLSSTLAGQYALLSLVGKMIFFFGSLFTIFMITLVSRAEGQKKNPRYVFLMLMVATTFLVFCGVIFLGPLGYITVPILFGEKAYAIVSYLNQYSIAMALFTLANAIVIYRLSRQQYIFPIIAVCMSLIMGGLIFLFHSSIETITTVVLIASFINFIIIVLLDFILQHGRFFFRNVVDLIDLFFPIPKGKKLENGKKRILILNWRDTKHIHAGGAEVYIHELAKRLVEDGHKATIFCGNDSKCKRYEVIDGVQIIRRGGFYFVYLWAFFYYIFKFRNSYDLVIDCQNGVPFFTPLYIRQPIFCLMFHVHQEVFSKHLPPPFAQIASFLERDAMPWAYRNVQFIAISESTKKDMESLGIKGKGIEIIYSGVDTTKLTPGKKNKNPIILYLGRLKGYKSVHHLIYAFQKVLENVPNSKLVIAGSGEEESKLKNLSKKLGLLEKIQFMGKVTEIDKVKLLRKAWVCVNPSMMEGWGITNLEANACGTPVVAADVPGLRESVNNPHTGYLVKYGNIEELSSRINLLLSNNELRSNMYEECRLWAKKFSWKMSLGKLNKLIQI